ncbi:raffinose/stachyose/melibiose transport system substrate-binding protein [Bacillus ectoiniformans]|uniref:ABC transporter substrate-binding protein n=1 Tax=Bacillus ectoiniformans TaxID=1494429 RepID=UPI001959E6FB|nr:ABC transporter substrate-binding protein [Bacillus ectoiniformans]MBM7649506.1 raffinose/stachyose/melibiose transport system substrate-binding protein [Bacillus ectoiniformans]
MKSKKFYGKVATVAAVSGMLLAGCGSSDSDKEKSGSAGENVTIDIFQAKVEFKSQFEELVKQYEEKNPGVKINVKTVGGGTDYAPVLKSSFSAGEDIDIFNVTGPQDVIDYKKYLTDLADTKAAGSALEGTLTTVQDGEKVLGLPMNQEGYGLIYNKNIFKKAGIDPASILTHEDLEKAAKKLDSQKKKLGIEAVFALPGKEAWVMGDHLANTFLADEFNGDVMEAFKAKTVAFEKGDEMKRFLDLQNKYSVQPVLSLDYSQQVEEYFSLERVAMIQQGNWVYPSVEQMDPELAENIGVLPIPVTGHEGSIPVGVPNYWAVNSQSDKAEVEESKKFLDWLYTSDEGKEAVLTSFKFIPAFEGYDTDKISDPLSKDIYKYASEGKTIGWIFTGYPSNPWGTGVAGSNMQKYLSGEMTWDEVVKDSIAKWEQKRK